MNDKSQNVNDLTNTSKGRNQTSIKYWTQISWILPVTFDAILIAVTLWVLFSLIHYGKKTKKWSGHRLHDADKLHSGWVYSSTVACAVAVLIRLCTSEVAFNIGFNDSDVCEAICDILFVEYALVMFTNYIFLWLRQRVFYVNKMLNMSFSKTVRFLSPTSLILIVIAGIAVVLFNAVPKSYSSAPTGCIYRINDSLTHETYAWLTSAMILVIGQVLLVVLLLYPLQKNSNMESCFSQCACFNGACYTAKQKESFELDSCEPSSTKERNSNSNEASDKRKLRLKSDCSNDSSKVLVSQAKSSARVKLVMQRTIIFGSISLATDLILIILLSTSLLDTSNPGGRRFSTLIYDFNVVLNLLLVILSFSVYKEMLLSFCLHQPHENLESRKSSTCVSYV